MANEVSKRVARIKIALQHVEQSGTLAAAVESAASAKDWFVCSFNDCSSSGGEFPGFPCLDLKTGRLATRVIGAGGYTVAWTDQSVIDLVCPSAGEVLEFRESFLDMLRGVLLYGSSQRPEWALLVAQIRTVEEMIAPIKIADILGDRRPG